MKKYRMEEFSVKRDIDKDLWTRFVYGHPKGNIFQTPYFYKSCLNSSDWVPEVVFFMNSENEIVGLMTTFFQKEGKGLLAKFSERAIVYGGPLIISEDRELYREFLKFYKNKIKGNIIYTQFRNFWDVSVVKDQFTNSGYGYEEHLNILVDLNKTEEQLWKEVYSKRRNEIRRSRKEEVTFSLENSENALRQCYGILREVYSYAKLPLPSFQFFYQLLSNSEEREGLKIFTAKYEDKIIGCMMALVYKDTIYDFFAGSYREYYKKYPNDLIPWEVFMWGKSNGYKVFDFGGAGKPDVPYGVREYKKKFGGKFVKYGRFQIIHKPISMKMAKLGLKFWKLIR